MSLSAPQRLPLRSLPNFFETAQRSQNAYFRIFYHQTNNDSRAAIVVPKKQLSKAVDRNAIKRRVAGVLNAILIKYPGFDMAVVVAEKAAALETESLVRELDSLLQKMYAKHAD